MPRRRALLVRQADTLVAANSAIFRAYRAADPQRRRRYWRHVRCTSEAARFWRGLTSDPLLRHCCPWMRARILARQAEADELLATLELLVVATDERGRPTAPPAGLVSPGRRRAPGASPRERAGQVARSLSGLPRQ